jgi:hypothetical protein
MCPQKHARGIAVESIAASFSPVHALIRVDVIDEGSIPPTSLSNIQINRKSISSFSLSLFFKLFLFTSCCYFFYLSSISIYPYIEVVVSIYDHHAKERKTSAVWILGIGGIRSAPSTDEVYDNIYFYMSLWKSCICISDITPPSLYLLNSMKV